MIGAGSIPALVWRPLKKWYCGESIKPIVTDMEQDGVRYRYTQSVLSIWLFVAVGVLLGLVGAIPFFVNRLFSQFLVCTFAPPIIYTILNRGRIRSIAPLVAFALMHGITLTCAAVWGGKTGIVLADKPVTTYVVVGILLGSTAGFAEFIVLLFVCGLAESICPTVHEVDDEACPVCGYSLVGNTSGRCPECGVERVAIDGQDDSEG